MKRLLGNAVIVALAFVSPFALASPDRMAQVEQRMQEARERLNLSQEQLDQMTPVIENSISKRRGILSSYGIDPEKRTDIKGQLGLRKALAMKKELDAVRADTLQGLNGILTEEQLEEFKRMQAERQAEMRERIRGASSRRPGFQEAPGFGRRVTRFM